MTAPADPIHAATAVRESCGEELAAAIAAEIRNAITPMGLLRRQPRAVKVAMVRLSRLADTLQPPTERKRKA